MRNTKQVKVRDNKKELLKETGKVFIARGKRALSVNFTLIYLSIEANVIFKPIY